MNSPAAATIVNLSRRQVVCEHALVADRALARMRGLLGRAELPAGQGLLLEPASAIHTAFMRFSIDVLFLDAYLRVIKVVPALAPWRSAAARGARVILELAAGEARDRGVEMGDRLDLQEATLRRRAMDLSHDADPQAPGRQMPRRLLLISSDRRFRSVAGAILTRRGWSVDTADPRQDTTTVLSRTDADVVLVDASWALTTAVEDAANVRRAADPLGVVIVSDSPGPDHIARPVHPKWESFEELCQAIDRAHPQHADSVPVLSVGPGSVRPALPTGGHRG